MRLVVEALAMVAVPVMFGEMIVGVVSIVEEAKTANPVPTSFESEAASWAEVIVPDPVPYKVTVPEGIVATVVLVVVKVRL